MEKLKQQIDGYSRRNRDISGYKDKESVKQILNQYYHTCENQVSIFFEILKKNDPSIFLNFKKWISNQKKKEKIPEYAAGKCLSYEQNQDNGLTSQEEYSDRPGIYEPFGLRQQNQDKQLANSENCSDNLCLEQQSHLDKQINELKNQIKEEQNKIENLLVQIEYLPQLYEDKFGMMLDSSKNTFELILKFMEQKISQLEQVSYID
ncbi:hypothetical protein TTHERM_00312550 (macronuclear) [Tetrahymena thermophila SB210]|uniref:Uncharacterized protein n=1 Tax=Tetrahymena thermophila (strain SB210) TaxID=312017 RepID=Q22KM6_TETTS|nr:hypothetical protein TTHERM_00312550 [Tetrahymena thermophila SB210]EAR85773.1 hypothetical protein TTHERM_00312550 [Tetrahymena thermophila SB210]|eukprot:XP_001033436.1 hypothetical protein TTHERM_00312550 [Tetrahymena thermophila SB210]